MLALNYQTPHATLVRKRWQLTESNIRKNNHLNILCCSHTTQVRTVWSMPRVILKAILIQRKSEKIKGLEAHFDKSGKRQRLNQNQENLILRIIIK